MFKAHDSSFDLWLERFDERRYPQDGSPATSGPVQPMPEKPKSPALLKALADIETRFGRKA